mgnify:CR=1 FL=1
MTAAVRDESQTTTDIQREVTRVALDALDGTGFALAGSSAIREHGVTDRPTEDVDLFTSNVNIENFRRSVDQVLEQLRSTGYVVDEGRRTNQFGSTLRGCAIRWTPACQRRRRLEPMSGPAGASGWVNRVNQMGGSVAVSGSATDHDSQSVSRA